MPSFSNGAPLGEVRAMLNGTGLRKNNYGAGRAPGAGDDTSQGYEAGSRWLHAGQEWVATSVAAGAAVWAQPAGDVSALTGLVAPNTVSTGAAPIAGGWAPPLWTIGEVYNPQLTTSLADHGYPVAADLDGYQAVTLTDAQQITSKTVYRRQPHADVLLVARYRASGVDGTSTVYIGLYHADEGATTGGRDRGGIVPAVGANVQTWLVPASAMGGYRRLFRPFVRMVGPGSIAVQHLQVSEIA